MHYPALGATWRLIRFFVVSVLFVVTCNVAFAQGVAVPVPTDYVGTAGAVNLSARPAATKLLYLDIGLKSTAAAGIPAFVQSLYNPKSSSYHKWISPAQFGSKFGDTNNDIDAVVRYLNGLGFTKVTVQPNKLLITAQTTRAQAENAFETTIEGYNRPPVEEAAGLSPTFYAPSKKPLVAATVANSISFISGLSNEAQARPAGVLVKQKPLVNGEVASSLDGPDLANIYGISALHNAGNYGQGQTIAIFSPTNFQMSDLTTFLAQNQISNANINIKLVDGGPQDYSGQDEACLDIETIVAQDPQATINVYEGPFSVDLWTQIANDGANVASASWGSYEFDYGGTTESNAWDTAYAELAAEGTSVFVAAGDTGAFLPGSDIVTVNFLASDPNVTAVGGTELDEPFGAGETWDGETAWTYNDGTGPAGWGGGGGLSVIYPEPTWQVGPGVDNAYSTGYRQLPDVSALASKPFYDVYTEGTWGAYLGTSCSTPLWASAVALINEATSSLQQSSGIGNQNPLTNNYSLGNLDPLLYYFGENVPSVYHDVTSGWDGVYYCTPGWDYVTGWGSADFGALYSAISTTFTQLPSPTFSPGSGTYTTTQQVTLSDTQAGVSIWYTTDGSTPSPGSGTSQLYTGLPITVTNYTIINAIAVENGFANSSVSSAAISIADLASPTFTPNGGSFNGSVTVRLSDPGATIYYFTNNPAVPGGTYTGPFTLTSSTTVTAYAYEFTGNNFLVSNYSSATFTITPNSPAPTITPGNTVSLSPVTVTIADSNPNAVIYYTTDGSTPSASSPNIYTVPFSVSSPENVQAIAIVPGDLPSPITTVAYTVGASVPLPVISPDGGPLISAPTVSITDSVVGSTIYYTTNGATPVVAPTEKYIGPLTAVNGETIKAIAIAPNYHNSAVAASAPFVIGQTVPEPSISPDGSSASATTQVTLGESQTGASIYYTINGLNPTTTAGILYTGPFTVTTSSTNPTITLQAVAVSIGYNHSIINTATFNYPAPQPTKQPAKK